MHMGLPQPNRIAGKWLGATVVILGSGPSLTREQVDYCRGKAKVIAINDSVKLAPWADILYFCDRQWFDWHTDLVLSFKGEVITLKNFSLKEIIPGLKCLEQYVNRALSLRSDTVYTGHTSGVQAINLAFHLGAQQVILLGVDINSRGGKTHWFGEHPISTTEDNMAMWAWGYNRIAEALMLHDMTVVNASPGTHLKCFPKVVLAEVL